MTNWYFLICYCLLFGKMGGFEIPTPRRGNATELYDTLATKRYKHVRPKEDYSKPIEVNMTFSLVALNEINEVSGTMSFTSFLVVSWIDETVRWDFKSNGLFTALMPHDEVWTPNLVIVNPGGEMKKLGDDYTYVRYVFDGRAFWQPTIIMSTACNIDITYYPFDTQKCNILFMSWMTAPGEVKLSAPVENADLTYFQKNGEWEVLSVKHKTTFSEALSLVEVVFELKRKPIFHIVNIILPIIFLGFINPLVFVLPVECGERISYAITVLLSFAVFMTLVSDRMPETSEPQAVISVYLALMLVYSVLIMLLTILSLRLYFRNDDKPVPRFVRKILMVITFKIFCPHERTNAFVKSNKIQGLDNGDVSKIETGKKEEANSYNYKSDEEFKDWKTVALTVDFIIFIFSLLSFVVLSAAFLIYIGS